MSSDRKKRDFDRWQREDVGGDKKAHAKGDSASRTRHKENAAAAATPDTLTLG